MKIIYIISFPPAYEYNSCLAPDHFWYNTKGEMIGIWRQDWGHVFARDVKRFYPECGFEVWRPDYRAEKEYMHIFEDGVIHRSFPAQQIIFWRGLKPEKHCTSKELISKFTELIEAHIIKKDLVCHIPLDFSYLSYYLLNKFGNKVPFLHTSHLNPDLLNVNLRTYNPLSFFHRLFIRVTYHKYIIKLKEIAVSEDRIAFFKQHTRANVYQLDLLNLDLEWGNRKIDKEEARIKLNLPLEKKIIFSSSRLVPEKQIDKLILSLSVIKRHDFICYISGSGEPDYENYLRRLCLDLSMEDKIIFTEFLDQELADFYCASDLFISTSISEGGPVSVLKAIALDIPVISTNTGIAWHILKENKAGVIIDKYNTKEWPDAIEEFLNGKQIKVADSSKLREKYKLEISINQLVTYYKLAISNFYHD
jgi:glycosyltransferase involved in cell wall biosynthesis